MKQLRVIISTFFLLLAVSSYAEQEKATSKDLREMVFSLKAKDIGINKDNFPFPVWGTVMETGFKDSGYFTLVVLADGTVSFYLGNGGGIIGGGSHENVRKPAGRFLIGSKEFYEKARLSSSHPAPGSEQVAFYFLTNDGVFKYSAPETNLGEGRDKLSPLFHAGHAVITELRKIQGG